MADEFREAIEIIPGRYYVCFVKRADSPTYSAIANTNISYCIDNELLYEPFYADFGPLNLGKAYRFCEHTRLLLQEADKLGKKLYLYAGPQPQHKANAAVLVGMFQVLYLNRTPDEAYAPLAGQAPYMPFRDASCGVPTFNLQPIDCIRGIAKARDCGFIDASNGSWRFDLAEYEHYEQVENGDLNWIVPGKLVAFSGPAVRPTDYVGFRAMVPEDYWEYWHKRGVQSVVRLNKKVYDSKRFLDGGFQHHELYFPDGSCPSQEILLRFLAIAEATPGALAIHCKAGLGRTGVLICSYIMKHYKFTAEEVIGYIRICRPGSVIGPQQGFIKDIQRIMWMEGDAYKAVQGPHPPPLMWGLPMPAAQAAATTSKVAAAAADVDANNRRAGSIPSYKGSPAPVAPSTPTTLNKSLSDLSLKQLQECIGSGTLASTLAASSALRAGVIRTPSSSGGGSSSGGSSSRGAVATTASFGSSSRAAGMMAPQRLFSSLPAAASAAAAGPLMGGLLASRPVSQQVATRPLGSSSCQQPRRSSSTNRERAGSIYQQLQSAGVLCNSNAASLRATLHTDTVGAANRSKAPMGVISQSSDFAGSGWRTPLTPGAVAGSSRPSSTIARVLAPNGQPRKLPAAALVAALAPPAVPASGSTMVKGTAMSPATPQQQAISGRLSAYYSS